MSEPKRIQRRRTRGWRKPAGAVIVDRTSRWGNPWKVGSTGWTVEPGGAINREPHPPLTAEQATQVFENSARHDPDWVDIIRAELAGKDLACWCPMDQSCHADVLLAISNDPGWSGNASEA